MDALANQSGVTLADTLSTSVGATRFEDRGGRSRLISTGWVVLLFAILAFLVLYPVAMLLVGAFTDSNPVVDGLAGLKPSLGNFVAVLTNPNVLEALINSLIACGGGTALALRSEEHTSELQSP